MKRFRWYKQHIKDTVRAMRIIAAGDSLPFRRKMYWDEYLRLERIGEDRDKQIALKAKVELIDELYATQM